MRMSSQGEAPIHGLESTKGIVAGDYMGKAWVPSLCEDRQDTEMVSEANGFSMTAACAGLIHLCCLATCLPGVCQGLMPLLTFRSWNDAGVQWQVGNCTLQGHTFFSFCILKFLSHFFLSQILVLLCLPLNFWCWISLRNNYIDVN